MSDELYVYMIFVFFGIVLVAAVISQFYKPSPKVDKQYVCTECLSVGHRVQVVGGNGFVQVVLFMCGILPGIVYSVWRSSTVKQVCPACRHATMIPTDTPRGKMLMVEVGRVMR